MPTRFPTPASHPNRTPVCAAAGFQETSNADKVQQEMEEVKAANQRLAAQMEQVSACRAANEAALEKSRGEIAGVEAKCLQVTLLRSLSLSLSFLFLFSSRE